MSIRSKKRRRARRERFRRTLALIARTGVVYVSPDVWERLQARAEGAAPGRLAKILPGLDVVVVPHFERGTIAGIDRFAPRPLVYEPLGPPPPLELPPLGALYPEWL
ncbi:hypothetical protein [Sandaracinus amylolyticus]|uniref:hypothetical protein n=1 Tax=Sandaracinus amylolyticus TaxID=927083 RepID=UPI001F2DF5E2|nr:hypothetical protein [Sandaracinus amylolyticus]UJR81437.1 Hypothetical protein I5071_34960 [Sandaracinus amylolyticus]